jgi:transposase
MVVLDSFAKGTGLTKILKAVFGDVHRQILVASYYLCVTGGALSHCEAWAKGHEPSNSSSLSSQRISELLGALDTDKKQSFFLKWMEKVVEHDYLCYDITSVSSYSQLNEYIKYGHNRDKEKLPQLNLAMLFGQKSQLPVYYHRLPGSITDVGTLENLLDHFKMLDVGNLHYIMDKGFYSKKNVDRLVSNRDKFTLAVPMNNKWVQKAVDEVYDTIHGPEGYQKIDDEVVYVHSRLYPWGEDRRRCCLHLYFNATNRAVAIDRFNEELLEYREELESGSLVAAHQEAYDTFFIIQSTPKRGQKISFNTEAVSAYIKRYAGFQALISHGIKDPVKAMQVYRDKDAVEKCFDDLKNSLDMKRLRMHSSATVDGRLFVQFIAVILISTIRKKMRETSLIKDYTVRELLLEMETLTRIKYSGRYKSIVSEATKKQKHILETLGIPMPD